MPDIRDLEPLIGRWSQVVDAPRHLEEKVAGKMTLEWLREQKVILQRSIAENPMFPEGVILIMTATEDAEGDFTAHYFDSRAVARVLQMSFRHGVWKWWRYATGPDDFDQRFEGTLSGRSDDRQLLLPRPRRKVDPRLRRHVHAGPAGLLLGSGKPATGLDRLDLIDEHQLLVHPKIADHGPTLYQGGLPSACRLELLSADQLRDARWPCTTTRTQL